MTKVWRKCLFLLGFTLNCCIGDATKFTNFDVDAIGDLAGNLSIKWVVLVEDNEDVGLIKNVKALSARFVYHTTLNRVSLKGILSNSSQQLRFFQRHTTIATKESSELTFLVGQVFSPYFVTWIVFGDYTLCSDLYIPVNTRVIFVNSTSEGFSPMRVYHLRPKRHATVKALQLMPSQEKGENPPQNKKKIPRMNFENVTVDMLVLNRRDICMKQNGTIRKLECVQQDLLQLMGLRLNFSINVVECMEKEYPYMFPNGSESVLFLKLKYREVDFSAVGHVLWRRSNRSYMELLWPTYTFKTRMYLKQGRLAGRWLTYLRPLESSVWWGILVFILLTGIAIQLFEALLLNQMKFNFSFILGCITSTMKALQVFCNQALHDIPESYSLRIIFILKFFVVLIFFQAYCGYLVSSLTISVSHFPFRDLKGFFENQQYRIMTLRKGFHQFYFRKVIGDGRDDGFMLPEADLPETIQEAVDKLCREKYLAFSEFREDLLNFDKLNCRISELPTPFLHLFTGIAIPREAPLKEFIKRELLYLKSTGIAKRLGHHLSARSDFRESENEFTTVSMTQIFSIFIFLGLGWLVSSIILVVELIVGRCKPSGRLEKKSRRISRISSHVFPNRNVSPGMVVVEPAVRPWASGPYNGRHGNLVCRRSGVKLQTSQMCQR